MSKILFSCSVKESNGREQALLLLVFLPPACLPSLTLDQIQLSPPQCCPVLYLNHPAHRPPLPAPPPLTLHVTRSLRSDFFLLLHVRLFSLHPHSLSSLFSVVFAPISLSHPQLQPQPTLLFLWSSTHLMLAATSANVFQKCQIWSFEVQWCKIEAVYTNPMFLQQSILWHMILCGKMGLMRAKCLVGLQLAGLADCTFWITESAAVRIKQDNPCVAIFQGN